MGVFFKVYSIIFIPCGAVLQIYTSLYWFFKASAKVLSIFLKSPKTVGPLPESPAITAPFLRRSLQILSCSDLS